MIETAGHIRGDRGLAHHPGPVEQQVIIIEHVLDLLGFHIGAKQIPELGLECRAPRKC